MENNKNTRDILSKEFENFYALYPIDGKDKTKEDCLMLYQGCIFNNQIEPAYLYEKYKLKIAWLKKQNFNHDPSGQKYQNKIPTPYDWLNKKGWNEDVKEAEGINTLDEYLYGKNIPIFKF